MPESKKRPKVAKKQAIQSKEEMLANLRKSEKFQKKIAFIRGKFYPALIEASHNIEDSKLFLSTVNSVMMEKFLGFMREKNFKELNLSAILDPKDDKHEQYVALLSLFDDMSVFDAKDIIEGMKGEIELFIRDELESRPLSSLKTKWVDEI